MRKSKRDTEEAAKKNKVVTMPRTEGGEDAEETEKGRKKAAAKKPRIGGAKETKPKASKKPAAKKLKKEEYQGSKKELRHWAKKVVKDNCDAITGELAAKAKIGDLRSTEMLLELMEKKKKKKGGEGDDENGPSLAEQLMAGPTWEEVLEARQKAKEEEEGEAALAASS
jgi:hypothetical protein